jgi:hypothetical protein
MKQNGGQSINKSMLKMASILELLNFMGMSLFGVTVKQCYLLIRLPYKTNGITIALIPDVSDE